MSDFIRKLVEEASGIPPAVLALVLFLGAFLEYIFPPFPGDLWTAAGAVLIARGASFLGLFLAANLGSLLGLLLDYGFGRWLGDPHRRFRHRGPRWERLGSAIDRTALLFQRHTAFYLVVNRFLPGVRALFFVAAGFARVPALKVAGLGLVSAAAWNALIMGGGYAAGVNLDRLEYWISRYTWTVWAILGAIVLTIAARFLARRRRRRREKRPVSLSAPGGQPRQPR